MEVHIVGGTRGLGSEIAKKHEAAGWKVNIWARRKSDEFVHGVHEIDVSLPSLIDRMRPIVRMSGGIDRLVWCVGFIKKGPVDELTPKDITGIVNAKQTALLATCGEILTQQGELKSLIGISSTTAYRPRQDEAAYAAANAGMAMALRSLALDKRIGSVLEIAPAGMNTSFWSSTDTDTTNWLSPHWVAEEVMKLADDTPGHRGFKILRDPPRVEKIQY